MKDKLKIGVLIDNHKIPFWALKMLQKHMEDSSSKIVLIAEIDNNSQQQQSLFYKLWLKRKVILYSAFDWIDKKLHKNNPDAFELKDIYSSLNFDGINSIKIKLNNDEIASKHIETIKKYSLDVIINLSSIIPDKNSINLAKSGFWSLISGDYKKNIGGPPGFWEVIKSWDETGVALQIIKDNPDKKLVLNQSFSLTHHTSPNRNRNIYYWKALSFIPLQINELYKQGENNFFKKLEDLNAVPNYYSKSLYNIPSNKEMVFLVSRLIFKKLKNNIRSRFYLDQWILLFHINSSNNSSNFFFKYKKMLPSKDRFWADPFVLKRDSKYYIFFEELMYSDNKGYISLIIMDEEGNYESPVKVLETDYHLSYPFLIEDKGELYMIPESAENKNVQLYKCTDFPLKWKLEKVLMNNIKALDSTIIYRDDKYWLFANVVQNNGASSLDELFLYHSDNLVSDNWIPHPQNPIVSDVKRARPAGKFFERNGNLYRPSQNCSKRYGYGMKINEVIRLDENNYQEKEVDSILPDWDKNLIATHTINTVDKLVVIDAMARRRKFF